ncbi:MAG TPA: helix-hairpin-helix domain-containing protein [Ramlibacter sp.]|jgi:competence protein ComEA|uniref:ComEA family DNA-binding protein n=1 Tax=Ramlibacter sp. TaxID=1917967 RepID=UPI002D255F37|nr:helix-hairpin-helix domain-containing protein [Ramlibacter sp.]HZY20466.1 helix-hairpin-helix domain-containing protein [Ramlibacter sp.]
MFKKILAVVAMLYTALAMAAVDVNKASEAELDSVKGIGPGTSKLIITERKKGEFKSWDDFISRVKGVGDKRAGNLSEAGLTVGGKGYTPAAAGAAKDDKAAAKTGAKSDAKSDAKAAKAEAGADKAAAKSDAKAEKKAASAEAKADKKEARADAKAAAAAKPAASASK